MTSHVGQQFLATAVRPLLQMSRLHAKDMLFLETHVAAGRPVPNQSWLLCTASAARAQHIAVLQSREELCATHVSLAVRLLCLVE